MGGVLIVKKLLFVLGTRPEGIKMCPLILEAKSRKEEFSTVVINTGQHKELVDSVFNIFKIKPNYNLNSMIQNQTLSYSLSNILSALGDIIKEESPDYVIVQGDTTSTFAGALAGYYNKIPVVHLEAGMRSGDNYSPFPEEGNRKMVSQISSYHFCATSTNQENLIKEGIKDNIFVVGNTGLDAISYILSDVQPPQANKIQKKILLTLHRREAFNSIEPVIEAINYLSEYGGIKILFPMHPNPNLRKAVKQKLRINPNIECIEPLDYPSFLKEMLKADIILTDSGGVQEEAPFLGKPVIVLREKTERTETLGKSSFMYGFNKSQILYKVMDILEGDTKFEPDYCYGDGKSSKRICDILLAK